MVRCAKCCSSSKGKLDLDPPAKRYAPEIGKLQVIEGFDAKGEPMLRAPKRDNHHSHADDAHRRLHQPHL